MKLASFALSAAAFAAAQTPKTVWDGVYSEAQARRGEVVYHTRCEGCHGANLEGKPDPSLVGPAFIDRWREDNLSTLYNHIAIRMPARAPGTLGEPAYLDVLAFILRSNEMPPGNNDLTVQATGQIRVIHRSGPQPLPSNTIVLTVGCFTAAAQGPGKQETWSLTRAVDPMRTKEADETNPEELQRSAAMALGSQSYRLQNLDFFRPDFKPAEYRDQKVQIKGVLFHQTANDRLAGDRINVTSVERLPGACN